MKIRINAVTIHRVMHHVTTHLAIIHHAIIHHAIILRVAIPLAVKKTLAIMLLLAVISCVYRHQTKAAIRHGEVIKGTHVREIPVARISDGKEARRDKEDAISAPATIAMQIVAINATQDRVITVMRILAILVILAINKAVNHADKTDAIMKQITNPSV